jgi:hypothetical protein
MEILGLIASTVASGEEKAARRRESIELTCHALGVESTSRVTFPACGDLGKGAVGGGDRRGVRLGLPPAHPHPNGYGLLMVASGLINPLTVANVCLRARR